IQVLPDIHTAVSGEGKPGAQWEGRPARSDSTRFKARRFLLVNSNWRSARQDQGENGMKYVKMLGLLAVAAAALMAFAGTASATTVTSSTGSTPTIHADSEGATTLHGVVDVTCNASTVQGTVSQHGTGVTVKGNISTLTFTSCGSNDVTVNTPGSLEVHAINPTGNGTLTSSGAQITIQVTSLGISCVFTTNNTHIGTYTSAANNGGVPTMHIDSASIPRTGG